MIAPTTTFTACVYACWDNPDLMREYRRLTGATLGGNLPVSALDAMIDRATGHDPSALDDEEVRAFLTFVRDCIWLPLVFKGAARP